MQQRLIVVSQVIWQRRVVLFANAPQWFGRRECDRAQTVSERRHIATRRRVVGGGTSIDTNGHVEVGENEVVRAVADLIRDTVDTDVSVKDPGLGPQIMQA